MAQPGRTATKGMGVNLGQSPSSLSLFMGGANSSGTTSFDIVHPNQTTWPYSSFTSLFTVLANGNVGIGTPSPGASLDLGGFTGVRQLFYGAAGTNGYQMGMGVNLGQSPNSLSLFMGGAINSGISSFEIVHPNQQTWPYSTYTTMFTVLGNGNVGIGTASPQHLLHVAGTIGAEEVIVSATGADYVFDPGYRLSPLTEVADYIQANHHLPEIPSAKEVQEKGVSLGDMQSKLLAKIEELTLHMIQAEKENADLRQKLQRLDATVQSLQTATPERIPAR